MAFGEFLAEDVRDEVQIAGRVDFGHDEAVEMLALEDFGEVVQS